MMVAWGECQEVHEALRARGQVTREQRSCRRGWWESRLTVRL